MIRLMTLLVLTGCAKEEVEPSISGSLSLPEHGEGADILWDKGFGFVEGSRMIAFLTGSPDATCQTVAAYLGPNTGALPKDDVLDAGSCTMLVKTQEWDGGWSAHYPDPDASYPPSIESNIRCDFGDGEWVLEERGEGYEDYYWTGTVWQGIPDAFEWDFSGGSGGFELNVEMSRYDGGFLYSDNHDEIAGSGNVSGTLNAAWCGDLENATVL